MRAHLPIPIASLIVAIATTLPADAVLATTVAWNTFLGNAESNAATGVARDADGNIYVTGTSDTAFGNPVRAFSIGQDAFVAKLDGLGNRVWITFLGGNDGDYSRGIALDGDGGVYASGNSIGTWGAPVKVYKANGDAYVAKLDQATGELLWNTFIGGEGYDTGDSITVSGKAVFVIGGSSEGWGSSPVRAYTAGDDVIVVKLDAEDGSMIWHTFLGGTGYELGTGSTADAAGSVYVTGRSYLPDWGTPVRPYTDQYDAFAAKVDPDTGALVWHTFLGGAGLDFGRAIAADAAGNLFVAGISDLTWGNPLQAYANEPVNPQFEYDAFAARLSAATGALAWNTFLGSTGEDFVDGIAVDGVGGVYLVGRSGISWGSPLRAHSASIDAYAARFEGNTGVRTWNTFVGGDGSDIAAGVASDAIGNLDVVGFSTDTWGSPVDPYLGEASDDAYVARLRSDLTYRDGFEGL